MERHDNRIVCTFFKEKLATDLLSELQDKYTFPERRIFFLDLIGQNEYLFTYNLELFNINALPKDSILVHRRKDTNTLYTINAINDLIRRSNGGVLDKNFNICWKDFTNSILFFRDNQFCNFRTKLIKIFKF